VTAARPPALPRAALLAGLVLLATAVWMFNAGWTIARFDRARFTYDSAQYALAARELAATGRLATPYSYVGPLREPMRPPWPLLAGHPLVPLLQAPVFALFGPEPWGSVVPVMLGYFATVLLGALLVLELSGGTTVAALVGVALAGTPVMLLFASDGLSEMPFTAAWTAAMLVVARMRRAGTATVVRPLVLGLLLGLAHLARPVVTPTIPLWLAAAAWAATPRRRLRTVALVVAGFAPCAGAWLLYKQAATGQAFYEVGNIMLLAGLAPEFGAHDVARLLHPPDAIAWIRAHPAALAAKLARNVPTMLRNALHLGGWAVGLSFVWAVVRPVRDGWGPLRLVAGGSLLLLALLCSLTLAHSHYLFPMLPAAVAIGAVSLARLLRRARLAPVVAHVLLGMLLLWSSWRPLAAGWRQARSGGLPADYTEREIAGLGATIARRLPPGTILTSDMAPWLSWYAHRPSVNLPLAIPDLDELRDRHGVGAVVVTNEWLISLPGNEAWRDLHLERSTPAGWITASVVKSGRLRARVLVPDRAAGGGLSRRPPASPAR
jgi:4-amino-4-deoxy-L-arabinose transferase-like glycosyltransferase